MMIWVLLSPCEEQCAEPYRQGVAFNFTRFESRITYLLYTAINTTEHVWASQCLGFTKQASYLQYNILKVSYMTIEGIRAISQAHLPWRDAGSCVTSAISCQFAFLRLLKSGWVWVKTWAFKYPHKKVCCSKVQWIEGPLFVTKPTEKLPGECSTWGVHWESCRMGCGTDLLKPRPHHIPVATSQLR